MTELATQPKPESAAMTKIGESRAAQEVQAAMVIAKRFPREVDVALARIRVACQRKGLAEVSQYAYPRGNITVDGPSIRLAETLAQCWGNLDFGVVEVEQGAKDSTVMAYCWDLETNTRQTKIFTVPHKRYTRAKTYDLTDPRDIYEATANQGARRLRACILGVVPGDIVQAAVDECNRTLTGGQDKPLADRIRDMAATFKADFGITKKKIELRLGHKLETTSEVELVALRKVYASLKDNMASVASFFPDKEVGTLTTDTLKPGVEPNRGHGQENLGDVKPGELKCPKCLNDTTWSPQESLGFDEHCPECGTKGIAAH
jgi:hypothetical protein